MSEIGERLDPRIDVSQPNDDEPDMYALWEAGEADLPPEEEATMREAIAKVLSKVAVEQKLAAHEHTGFDPLKHPRVPKGSGDESGEFISAHAMGSAALGGTVNPHALARALRTAVALDPDPITEMGPSGTDPTSFRHDEKRVLRRQKAAVLAGLDTQQLYDKIPDAPGVYRPERTAAHEDVINHFLNKPGVKSERKMVMMGGLPGAGKTYFLTRGGGQDLGINLDEYVTVNPDDVKEYMATKGYVPQYQGMTEGESSTMYHEESTDLAKMIMERAAARGMNIAFDTSLKDADQGQRGLSRLDANGDNYQRTLIFVDVPISLAQEQAIYRYQSDTGRFTPATIMARQADPTGEYFSKNRHGYEEVKDRFDRVLLVQRKSKDSPMEILEKRGWE